MTSKLSVQIESFTPRRSNTLHGFCTIVIPELHLKIHDVSVHQKDESRWISLPGKPQLTPERTVKYDDRGKLMYFPVIEFVDPGTRNAFSQRVIDALLAQYPGAFDAEAAA